MSEIHDTRTGSDVDKPLDPLLNTAGRDGLTGTTPATLYEAAPVRDQITLPPDGRPLEAQPQWRKDFPVDWPQDQYVARRDFTKFMVLTSLAFAAGQVWIGVRNVLRRRRGEPPIQRLAKADGVRVGSAVVFYYPTPHDPCLLIRAEDNVFMAYSQSCTHLSCAVVPRVKDDCLHCPCHEGYFDLRSGRPTAGPPRRPLARIQLKVTRGVVYATGFERRTV